MDKARFKSGTSNKGRSFYIVLSICLIAIGAATWTTYNSVMDFVKGEDSNKMSEIQENITQEKPAGNTLSGIVENTSESAPEIKEEIKSTVKKETKETLFVYPSSKEVLKVYSESNPLYSKTFKDWRVHNGIDFLSDQGSKVKAITDGKVVDIYDDPSWGMTMVIDHNPGFTAFYSGLGDTTLVNKDDSVSVGQEIASINDVPCEICDEPHLHLSIRRDNQWVDPMEVLENAK